MKKIVILLLVVMLVVSAVPMAYAADTQDYTLGTAVEYTADADENRSYTITVPAELQPGQSGTVTLKGMWASNETVKVTADANVVLTNSINAADKHTLDIEFDGIEKAGDNTVEKTYTETVSVEEMPADALFGIWSGKFNYNVEFKEITYLVYNEKYILTEATDSGEEGSWMIFREDGTLEWYAKGTQSSGTHKYVCEGTTIKDYWGEGENDYIAYIVSEDGKTIDGNPDKTWSDMVFIYTLESAIS